MKFTLPTDIFRNITNTLTKVITKDVPGAQMGGVLITVSSGVVSFKAQQFDFGIIYSSNAGDSSDGSVSVSISVLDGIVSSLIDTTTTVELKDSTIVVSTNTSTSNMYILEDAEEDVSVVKPEGKPLLSVKREILLRGFKNVQYAASDSFVKPEIASVYLYTKDDSIYFVSTDAFRLSEMRFLSEGAGEGVNVLIPIKSVTKLVRVLEGVSDADVSLFVRDNDIYIEVGSVLVKMNNVSGSFPDYKSIMPTDFSLEIILLKSDVVNFLKKARLFANKLNKLSITVADEKTITLDFSNETVGSTTNTIPAVIKGSVDSVPSFNYKFIHDVLSVITDDRIILSAVNDVTKPLMIRGADDSALTAIISPLLDKQE